MQVNQKRLKEPLYLVSVQLPTISVRIGATYMENSATVSPLVFQHVRFITRTGKGYNVSTVYMKNILNVFPNIFVAGRDILYIVKRTVSWYVNARVVHAWWCRFMCCYYLSCKFFGVENARSKHEKRVIEVDKNWTHPFSYLLYSVLKHNITSI